MAWEREPQVCTLMPNFTIVGKKKCVPTAPNGIFWYKFAKMGISPGNWTFRSQDHSLPGAKVPGVALWRSLVFSKRIEDGAKLRSGRETSE